MLKITGFRKATTTEGREFFIGIVTGDKAVPVISVNGNMRLEIPSVQLSIPATSEEQATMFIGTEVPGKIVRQKCEPFTFVGRDGNPVTCDSRNVIVSEDTIDHRKPVAETKPATTKKATMKP